MKRPPVSLGTQPLPGKDYRDTLVAVTCRPDNTMIVGTYKEGESKSGFHGFVCGGRDKRKGKPETDRQTLNREWREETKTKPRLTLLHPSQFVLYHHRLPHNGEPEKNTRMYFTLVGRPVEAALPNDTKEMKDFKLPEVDEVLKLIRHAANHGFQELAPTKARRNTPGSYNFMRSTMLALDHFAALQILPGQRNFGGWKGTDWGALEENKTSHAGPEVQ